MNRQPNDDGLVEMWETHDGWLVEKYVPKNAPKDADAPPANQQETTGDKAP